MAGPGRDVELVGQSTVVALDNPHSKSSEQVSVELAVVPARGLTDREVDERRAVHGPNVLEEAPRRSWLSLLARQFSSVLVWLLTGAAVLSFAFDDVPEGIAIIVVIVINAAIGFATEARAAHSMEALRGMARVVTRVRRDGRAREVAADDLVPGDVVLIEAGDVITADLRLVDAANMECDESTLTSESAPVAKSTDAVMPDTPLAERVGMAFKGTAVTRGDATALVVATGMATELGRISVLVHKVREGTTPLEARLDRLGRQLLWLTVAITAAIAVTGILGGSAVVLMVQVAIALAVAAVPEGLPVVTTLALARGMWRMARRNAVIEDLPAVETLGATTVICTDKTGTLTENRMQVARIADAAGVVEVGHLASGFTASPGLEAILDCGALCNGAELEGGDGGGGLGDPMEVALLLAARKAGIERAALLERLPEIRREPFDSAVKMMATYHRDSSQILIAVKGAPETVVVRARDTLTEDGAEILDEAARRAWLARAEELAGEGLRVLALAHRRVETPEAEPFQNLTLLGLVGLLDPAREGVAEAIGRCHDAGIRVVMVTGDHGVTARAIAADVGLCNADAPWRSGAALDVEPIDVGDCDVFARVSPEQKLRLVEYFQRQGDVVAMTGDGVNDAPALKKAEIGVAMGLRGTQVAREAAEMVLRDDAFATIVLAVEQGRVIFANIRKFVFYLLSCNTSEILVIGLATVAGMPLPLLPLQILFLDRKSVV